MKCPRNSPENLGSATKKYTTIFCERKYTMTQQMMCYNCRFFSPGEHGCASYELEQKLGEFEESLEGVCRRHFPRVGQLLKSQNGKEFYDYGVWPIVLASQWCGEFQPRARCHNGSAKNQPCGSVSKCTESCTKRHESQSVCNGKMAEENFTEKSCVCNVGRNDPNAVQKDTKAGCFAMVPSCQNDR